MINLNEIKITPRDQQVLHLLVQGCSNKEIASHLNLSEQTVKNHVHNILRKVGATDRVDVVKLCEMEISGNSAA